jgi:hypothetical protein
MRFVPLLDGERWQAGQNSSRLRCSISSCTRPSIAVLAPAALLVAVLAPAALLVAVLAPAAVLIAVLAPVQLCPPQKLSW